MTLQGTSSDSKLSDLARHVVIPSGIQTTRWPLINQRASEFGISFDRWQHGMLTVIFGQRSDGQYACGIGGAVLSIPRQTGKTYSIGWALFALATLIPDLLIVWTAHHSRTSDETFLTFQTMAKRPEVAPYVAAVRAANGQQQVVFVNGSRILFGAREHGFGRGMAKVDVLVFDEAQILSESALSNMVPATNAAPNGLALFMGTPPRPQDNGDAFASKREDALAGDEDTFYVEFSADENAKIIDWEQVRVANPSFPHRTSRTAILRMQKLMASDANFRREAYGIWDKRSTVSTVFREDAWDALETDTVPDGVPVFAVRFSNDGTLVAVAAALKPDEPLQPVFVEMVREAPTAEGLQWLVEWLEARQSKAAQIVIDGKAGAPWLINALRAAGVKNRRLIITPTVEQVIAAHSMFQQATVMQTVKHSGQPELREQALAAHIRRIGNQGGFGWQAAPGVSVASLEAVTLAFWGAKTTKRKPGKRQEVML